MSQEEDRIRQLYEIAKLYYEDKLSQYEISKIFKVSKATISRCLSEAEDKNIVQMKVVDILGTTKRIEKELENKYKFKKAIVSYASSDDINVIKKSIGKEAAMYITDLIKENQSIGIAWGTTLLEMINSLQPKNFQNLSVVELIGSIGHISVKFDASELARKFAENFGAQRLILQSPAFVNSIQMKNLISSEINIQKVLEMGKEVNIAIVGIGEVNQNSLIYQALNFSESEINEILNSPAVGDICFNFFDIDGNKCNFSFDDKIIGIKMNDFKKINYRIGIAGGVNKISAIKGAINKSIINVLITDKHTASRLL